MNSSGWRFLLIREYSVEEAERDLEEATQRPSWLAYPDAEET